MKHSHRQIGLVALAIVMGYASLYQACCTGSVYRSRLIPVREMTERIEAPLPLTADTLEALIAFTEADARRGLREALTLFGENAGANLKVANFERSAEIKRSLGPKPISTDIVNSCDEYEPDENTRRAYDVGQYVLIFIIDNTEYANDGGLIPDTARVFSRLILQKSFVRTGQK